MVVWPGSVVRYRVAPAATDARHPVRLRQVGPRMIRRCTPPPGRTASADLTTGSRPALVLFSSWRREGHQCPEAYVYGSRASWTNVSIAFTPNIVA